MGQSCTLRLDPRAERCAWEGPAGTQEVGLPHVTWDIVPEGLVGRDRDGRAWEAGVAVATPIGWLLRDGEIVEAHGDAARVPAERARRQRTAEADRMANATLAEGDRGIAELLEWAKLGLVEGAVPMPMDGSAAAWLAWWEARGCRAAVPRAAHAAVLRTLLGVTERGDGTAYLAPHLPAAWPGWRLERWRIGRSVLDVSVARRGDLVRCSLLPRHGPTPVLTVVPGMRAGSAMLVDGEPVLAQAARLELRGRVTLEWDAS